MSIATRSLQTLTEHGHLSLTVRRCCQTVHWVFTVRLGRSSGGS